MPIAITMDQRLSRQRDDLVQKTMLRYNDVFANGLLRPFERTSGDEMQALISEPRTAIEIWVDAVQSGDWWIGVGIGPLNEPIAKSVREVGGVALQNARLAVEGAKSRSTPHRFQITGNDERVEDLAVVLTLVAWVVERQTPAALVAEELYTNGRTQQEAAAVLKISQQAFGERIRRGGVTEKRSGCELAIRILESLESK